MATLILVLVLGTMPPEAKPAEQVEQTRRLAIAACVRIAAPGREQEGSGVVVGKRGIFLYVLTASHVVAGANKLDVRLATGDGKATALRDVEVLVDAPAQDVALLRVRAGEATVAPLPIATSGNPAVEDAFDALSAGYDGGDSATCRAERVLGKKLLRHRDGTSIFVWECRDRPESGRSGGPLIDSAGHLIGICCGTQDGKGYYCHQDEIRSLLKKHNFAWLYRGPEEK